MSEGEQRYCTSCGAQVRPGSEFCPSCGVNLKAGAQRPGPDYSGTPPPGRSPSFNAFNGIREKLQEAVGRLRASSHVFDGGTLKQMPGKAVQWFKDLHSVPKLVLVGVVLLGLLALLSPLLLLATVLLLVVSVIGLIVRVTQGGSLKEWGVVALASLVLLFVFGGVSNAFYGTEFLNGGTSGNGEPEVGTAAEPYGGDEPLSEYERNYVVRVTGIKTSAVTLSDRQIDLYNFCLEVCAPDSYFEQQQNMRDMQGLLESAQALDPPDGYEASHSALISGLSTAEDMTRRIPFGMIGGAEIDSLAEEAVGDFISQEELLPPEAQTSYDEDQPTGSV